MASTNIQDYLNNSLLSKATSVNISGDDKNIHQSALKTAGFIKKAMTS